MCAVCGCGTGETHIDGKDMVHRHGEILPDHRGHHHHHGEHSHDPAPSRLLEIEESLLSKNQVYADDNRNRWNDLNVLAVNFISSPGAGKTTLLVETLRALGAECPLAVIEGDQQTQNDANRIRRTGVPAVQINTGKGCHLDAHMVGHAAEQLRLRRNGILFIENIGNLVCPAGFDLGEHRRVVILSVTEGDDKPAKYPDAFASAHLLLLTKADLLPYVDFDIARSLELAREANPLIESIQLSAKSGIGMAEWMAWLRSKSPRLHAHSPSLESDTRA